MDILAALKREEAKIEKQVSAAQQQVAAVRAAIKILSGKGGGGTPIGTKKRFVSKVARAKMAKAQRERWAKFRAAEAKGKQ
jgi:hypothetical protein